MVDRSQVGVDYLVTDLRMVSCAEQHSAQAASLGVSEEGRL